MRGSSVMDQYISQVESRSSSARVAIQTSTLLSMLRNVRCTAGTMETGRRTPRSLLACLLASMKDADGRVAIDGWYSDVEPLGDAERRAIAEALQYDEELKQQLGIKRTEMQVSLCWN